MTGKKQFQDERAGGWIVTAYSEDGTRVLGFAKGAGKLTDTRADAARMSKEQAELLAHDLQDFQRQRGSSIGYRAECPPRFIDMTPTWRQAAHIIALALENGTDKGRDAARAELFRMAELLDQLKAAQNAQKEPSQ